MLKNVTVDVDETHTQAKKLLDSLQPEADKATVVRFVGPLGAGKTEFIRGLLRSAGVTDPVTSPTYTIETVYELPDTGFARAYHIDAYRLENESDLEDIGFADRLTDSKNLVLVEWADRVSGIFPNNTVFVNISIDGDKRVISIDNEQEK